MFGRRRRVHEIAPEEIFLDSSNLPRRDDLQFEGRVVQALDARALMGVGAVFLLVALVFLGRAFQLEVVSGTAYAEVSRENRLHHSLVFASRGVVYDRGRERLAWNELSTAPTTTPYALRAYTEIPGFSLLLGFVRHPRADASGNWWQEETIGVSGVEGAYNEILAGENGAQMVETDARGNTQMQNIVRAPQSGTDLTLSIDAEVQGKLFHYLEGQAERQGFLGGAAVIMDVESGEILALTSFPEYDNAAFTAGDREAVEDASSDPRTPLLNRAVSGLYAPGSIVKPIFAAAALNEKIIDPETKIVSTGALTVPNPYDPSKPSVFRDWAVHGPVNMREALAVSSDEYFYTIGGGFGSQVGLGIRRLDEYAKRFGLGSPTGISLYGEGAGLIPTPEWKEEVFGKDDPWRIGNTYHTAIGQFGFQMTPLQAVRFVAAIANSGKLLVPKITAHPTPEYTEVGIPDEYLQIVREGMRMAVTSDLPTATVKVLNIPGMTIAAKTGTAQIGSKNQWMNSWSIGFWPADNPKYAYAAVLEKAPAGTASGAAPGLRPFFDWLVAEKPEYAN